ncbi:hypothetical protein ACLOJK_010899 [Asimina triloba]
MKLQRRLRQQGIRGNSYRLIFGDTKEIGRLMNEAWSKPMNLTHQIAPRVFPYFHDLLQEEVGEWFQSDTISIGEFKLRDINYLVAKLNYGLLSACSDVFDIAKTGKLSLIWIGTTPRVIVNDPELMKQVLSNKFGHFRKPPINPLVKILTTGITNLEGEDWVKRRRVITHAFHVEKLKAMIPAFSTSCSEFIARWREMVGPQGSRELDVWPEFQNLTGDIISRTAFGSNYEEGRRIFELQKEQGQLVMEAAYSPYIPGLRFVPTKKNRRRLFLDKEIKAIVRGLIRKKQQAMRMGGSSTDDLLGLLLLQSSSCSDAQEAGTESKNTSLTTDDVIEECKLFYIAGQETTAVWLTWTMIVLAMHPNWQELAREEVTMILYEVLRLYPPVAVMLRHTYKKIELGGISLPQGVDLLLPTLLIHHDPEFWGDDREEFKPERFSEGVSKASNERNTFFPFGWGPRICIGQHFAMIEAKMAVAIVLQHFSLELSPSYAHAPYTILTLQPQYGAQLILHQL